MVELGKGKLLRTGLNALHQAIHPTHGLAWTDGNQVVLTDCWLHSGEVKFGGSKVIGHFEHVCGLCWAPCGAADTPSLLAVQHKKHVSVWQLGPSTTEKSKGLMSQTCEIRESLPVLPQGCVWHPNGAVLTVLTAGDVSVFPNVQWDSSRVSVNISTPGRIHCACWTQDGQRLVVAVGSCLHSFIWDSAQKTLHRSSSSPVFDVDSSVRCITATVDSQVAVATELPLDKICSLNASETFEAPLSGANPGLDTFLVADDVPSVDQGALASETDSETSPVSPSADLLDLSHISFSRPRSEGSSLICLRKKASWTGTGQDSSHLALVAFEKTVTLTGRARIPGILVPDLIACHPKAQAVAVASNTGNTVLVYSVMSSPAPNVQHIQLESSERPKGLCFLTDRLLLILVGKPSCTDVAFLPSSESEQYAIHLTVREVTLEEQSESQSACSTFSALLDKADRKLVIESPSPHFCPQHGGLLLTGNASSRSGGPGKALVEEIRSPPSSVGDGSVALEMLHRPAWAWATEPRPGRAPDGTSTPETPTVPSRKNLEREKGTEQLCKELETLSRKLTDMQRSLSELTDFVQNGKKPSAVYPRSQEPPYVHVLYQKPCSVDPVEKRAVLLCDGKLRLCTLQQMFGLSLIEMLHDSHWILLTADSEGFIPLAFTATQEIIIRDGFLSRSDALRDSEPVGDLTARSSHSTGLL
ncbi:WD repeat and coiled-coil-containing protein isoform X2 [Lepus europaeus]|nr:WD repeat and coiled-coil-containing protein isoform X2 [Lepus europaeus]